MREKIRENIDEKKNEKKLHGKSLATPCAIENEGGFGGGWVVLVVEW